MNPLDEVVDVFHRLTLEDKAQAQQDQALLLSVEAVDLMRQAIEELTLRLAAMRELADEMWEYAHMAKCGGMGQRTSGGKFHDGKICLFPRPEELD